MAARAASDGARYLLCRSVKKGSQSAHRSRGGAQKDATKKRCAGCCLCRPSFFVPQSISRALLCCRSSAFSTRHAVDMDASHMPWHMSLATTYASGLPCRKSSPRRLQASESDDEVQQQSRSDVAECAVRCHRRPV